MDWPPKLLAIYSDFRQNHLPLFRTEAIPSNLLGRLGDNEARSLALAQSTAKSKTEVHLMCQHGTSKKLPKANFCILASIFLLISRKWTTKALSFFSGAGVGRLERI